MALLEIAAAAAVAGTFAGNAAGHVVIDCAFSASAPRAPVVTVSLNPVPSLKDAPGLYRVIMQVDGRTFRANATPIAATADPDVLIRAKAGGRVYYTIGLREDGAAAMLVAENGAGETLIGHCQHHEAWFPGWLQSTSAE